MADELLSMRVARLWTVQAGQPGRTRHHQRHAGRRRSRSSAGAAIVSAGEDSPELYTLYSGWAFRFKTLPDGRRQILNFLLPGDLLGLQAAMFDAAMHGIEALTDVELCVLPRRKVWDLFRDMPGLAFDVTWLGSREESIVDENLTSVGRRNAAERVAALIVALYKRAKALGLVTGESFGFPLTQQHVADCARAFPCAHQQDSGEAAPDGHVHAEQRHDDAEQSARARNASANITTKRCRSGR